MAFTDPKIKPRENNFPKGYYTVDPPQLGSLKQTVMFGIISLMTIMALNVPIVIDNFTASAEGFPLEEEIRNAEHTKVRNHFSTDFETAPNLRDVDAALLEEICSLKNNFGTDFADALDLRDADAALLEELCSLKNNLADKTNSDDIDNEELSEGFGGRRES